MSETIYFNGKKYNSVAEMSPNVRKMYEKVNHFFVDANRDGVPDIIQSAGLTGIKDTVNIIKDIAQMGGSRGFEAGQISILRETDSGIYFNGKEYNSVEEMPNHIRIEYERIVNDAQDEVEDIYEESWREVDRSEYFKSHDDEIMNRRFSRQKSKAPASIEVVDSTSRFILITAVTFLILGCVAAAWFLIF